MTDEAMQADLDRRAEEIADLLDDLPWCECVHFLVAAEEEVNEPEPELNEYLQAYDVLIFDGYVTDYIGLIRQLTGSLRDRFASGELSADVTVDAGYADDPNRVLLKTMIRYFGPDEGYLAARRDVLEILHEIARRTVEEWTREEEEDPIETVV